MGRAGRSSFLNPPTVISVIALCAAIGGGAAIALSGGGSIERAKEVGIETGSFEAVAKLTGVGKLQATCSGTGLPVTLRFKNTSGANLVSRVFKENAGDYGSSEADDGEFTNNTIVTVGAETLHWVLSPNGGSAEPQADMSVTVTPSVSGSPSCAKSEVAVIATTTEQ